ncbi:hypothetical protein PPERSA_04926 [Pseudocohnilembus persalinus]|uniref:Uncharacterized protein n=1 Tax=Pseudocohnilembus persalinus TaxID=266149 RepID=A0A0V0R8D5_PSEPJ|nr:hypothetical protein PPERSA_04926 [Pseudocohnilembus persalinus]|eukprot:KRX10759.1 hypothetical protein PPERSA_04926 [Pseudocohnilembus persalinus]
MDSQQLYNQQKYQQQNKNKKQARPNSFALVNNQNLIEAQNIVKDISSYKSSLQDSLRSTLSSSNNNNNNLNHQQSQKQEQFQEIDNIFFLQKAQSLNQESPSFNSNQDIKILKTYDLQQLPDKYVKLYEYARQVVSTLKKKTILVKLENKEGIFSLMIDKQHFEAILKNGLKFQYDIFSQNITILSEKYYLNKQKSQQEQDSQKINVQKQITINIENETELQSLEHDFQTGIQIAMKYLNESLDKAENMQQ